MSAVNGASAKTAPGVDVAIEQRILVFNDPHIADRPPLGRKDDYCQAILNKLTMIGHLVDEQKITQVICTGDLFHYKNPKHTSLGTIYAVRTILSSYRCPVWIVPGNHYIPGGLVEIRKQPIGLVTSPNVNVIAGSGNSISPLLQMVWRPYDRKRDCDPTYYELAEAELAQSKSLATIMFAHGSIIAPGQTRPYPYITIDQINLQGITSFYCGHIHEDLGTHFIKQGEWTCQFTNVGALARTSRIDANMTRKIQVTILSVKQDIPLEFSSRSIVLDVPPAEEIFHEQVVVAGQEVPDSIIEFAESVAQGLQAETIDLDTLLQSMPEFPDIERDELRTIVRHYLEEAQV